jgi:hypothetical protein
MDFFDRVKELVKSNTHLTLKGFIETIPMNYDSWNTLKRYGNLPRTDIAVIIADKLGVSVEYLVKGNKNTSVSEMDMELLKKYHNLDESGKYAVNSLLTAMYEKSEYNKKLNLQN